MYAQQCVEPRNTNSPSFPLENVHTFCKKLSLLKKFEIERKTVWGWRCTSGEFTSSFAQLGVADGAAAPKYLEVG